MGAETGGTWGNSSEGTIQLFHLAVIAYVLGRDGCIYLSITTVLGVIWVYFEALVLGTCPVSGVEAWSSLCSRPFCHTECPSLSLTIFLVLQSILSDTNIATPVFFFISWNLFLKLNLLGRLQLIQLYRLQVYISMVQGLCIVCPPPEVKSSSITIYLAPFTFYYPPAHLPLVTTTLLSVSVSFSFMSHMWVKSYGS